MNTCPLPVNGWLAGNVGIAFNTLLQAVNLDDFQAKLLVLDMMEFRFNELGWRSFPRAVSIEGLIRAGVSYF